MFAVYRTDTGELVSIGSTVANPLPAGLTALDLGADDRLLTGFGYWDPATRTVKDVVPSPVNVAAALASLMDVTSLQGRLTRLAAYKTDPDLTAVLNQTNNQSLQTATLNRALKAIVRENQRQSAALAALLRMLDSSLLANIADTTDA